MTFAGITDVGAYVVGCIAIILLPGPNSLFVMSTSAIDGRVRGWAAVAGVLVADTVFIIGSGVGLVALLHALPWLFDVLRWAGSITSRKCKLFAFSEYAAAVHSTHERGTHVLFSGEPADRTWRSVVIGDRQGFLSPKCQTNQWRK